MSFLIGQKKKTKYKQVIIIILMLTKELPIWEAIQFSLLSDLYYNCILMKIRS